MMATLLALWFPRYRIIFFIAAGFIGWTRIYLGVHYPTDVIAGALLGYGITRIFLQWIPGLDIKAHYFRDEKGS
jgi:undecaprenyl-diphosphatase